MSDSENLSPLQENELSAMAGDRLAILNVISGLRKYRAEVKLLLSKRYSDGEVDSSTLSSFASTIEDIESEEL